MPTARFRFSSASKAANTRFQHASGHPPCLGWATGNLPEPKSNPQVGMANMRTAMPALQKAKAAKLTAEGLCFAGVTLPKQLRETKIVKDKSPDEIAMEIVEWIKK